MPINLKKTDIEFQVDSPDIGYLTLGFDANGTLVKKDENGVTTPILPEVSTGSFVSVAAKYLTLGIRSGAIEIQGLYSISQGTVVSALGYASSVRGINSHANGKYSTASGEYVTASGDYSYVWGLGTDGQPMTASGVNSFVHQYSTNTNGYGTLSDYSAILGGYNHDIGSDSDSSAIIGGNNHTISSNTINTVVLGGSNVTAAIDDVVYVPRLILSDGNLLGGVTTGMIRYNSVSGNIEGYVNGTWTSMTTIGSTGNFVTLDTVQTVTSAKTFSAALTFNAVTDYNATLNINSGGGLVVDNGASFTVSTPATFNESITGVLMELGNNLKFTNNGNHTIYVDTRTSTGAGYHLNIDAGIGSNNNNGGNLYLKAGVGNGIGVDGIVYIQGSRIEFSSDSYMGGDLLATQTWVTNTGGGMSQTTGDARYYRKDTTTEQRQSALSIAKIGYDWAGGDLGERLGQNAPTGWCRLFNGMILQWFTVYSNDDGNQAFTFPVAFPNACNTIVIGDIPVNPVTALNNAGFEFNRFNETDGNIYVRVWAIGY